MNIKGDGFELRPMGTCKLDAAAAVYKQSKDYLSLVNISNPSIVEVFTDLEASKHSGGTYYGIFNPEDVMVGVLDVISGNFAGNPRHALIKQFMLGTPYRRQGLGSRILTHLEDLLRQSGQVDELFVQLPEKASEGQHFLEKHGYQPVEEKPDPASPEIIHLYKRSLGSGRI